MPLIDPKDVPGTVGMIIRGELKNTCDLCGLSGDNHPEPKSFSYLPLAVNDPLNMWVMNAIYKSLGKDGYKTNPENKKPFHVTGGLCTQKVNEELECWNKRLFICDVCGAVWDKNKSCSITPAEIYIPETLNATLKSLGAAEFKPRDFCPIPFLTLCVPECDDKFYSAYQLVLKSQNLPPTPS